VEILWSPWRNEYINSAESKSSDASLCIFCRARDNPDADETQFVVHRAAYNLVMLNLYPYVSGHLMIAPYIHVAHLNSAPKETTDEMIDLVKRCENVLAGVYHPDGFNLGMNLGRAAGAGVANHIHMHIVPRWVGDTNFMTSVGETRVLPEDLNTTYRKLSSRF